MGLKQEDTEDNQTEQTISSIVHQAPNQTGRNLITHAL